MMQCKADAEDMVQDTFVKWFSMDQQKVSNIKAYLVSTLTNTCQNYLSSARRKWEIFTEEEPAVGEEADLTYIDGEMELAQAFATVVAKLEPLERAVFLLREVFNMEYEAVQQVIGKKQEHCRQLLCRARQKLSNKAMHISGAMQRSQELFHSFKTACGLDEPGSFISDLKNDIATGPVCK